jgi:hypothetical protein
MRRTFGLVLSAVLLAAAPALSYTVVFKDGTVKIAREKYTVKGNKAFITLPSGMITQCYLAEIDVPGTDKYNEKNPGDAVPLDTPNEASSTPQTTPGARLGDLIRPKKAQVKPAPTSGNPKAAGEYAVDSQSGPAVDQAIRAAFSKFFEGAGIAYQLNNDQGTLHLLSTANSEEAVFNVLSASARAVAELADKGRVLTLKVVMTTSGGESGGTFLLTAEESRQLVNGQIPVGDFFVKHVAL